MENAVHSMSSQDSVILVDGTAIEIGEALKRLGATQVTVGRALSSFVFNKIPGGIVTRSAKGFIIGGSDFPEVKSAVVREIDVTNNRFVGVLAANDERSLIAA